MAARENWHSSKDSMQIVLKKPTHPQLGSLLEKLLTRWTQLRYLAERKCVLLNWSSKPTCQINVPTWFTLDNQTLKLLNNVAYFDFISFYHIKDMHMYSPFPDQQSVHSWHNIDHSNAKSVLLNDANIFAVEDRDESELESSSSAKTGFMSIKGHLKDVTFKIAKFHFMIESFVIFNSCWNWFRLLISLICWHC